LALLLITFLLVCVGYEMWPERPTATIFRSYDGIEGNVCRTSGLSVQFWHEGDLFSTHDRFVFRSRDRGMSWEKVAKLAPGEDTPVGLLRNWVGRLKLVRRLCCTCGPNLRLLQDGTMLVACGGIYRGRIEEGKIVSLYNTHKCPTMLSQGWAEDRQGVVYFGEYLCGKHSVTRLYWSRDEGRTWEIRYEFPRTHIRHIHCVAYDPYRDLLWLATGDADHESRILYSFDQGAVFHELGGGSQDWRAVSLQFTREAIYWGTDSPNMQNHIFKWNWETGHREILLTVPNAFYYSFQDEEESLFFSTAVERPEIYGNSMSSDLWKIRCGKPPHRLVSWQKGELKGHGLIKFAQGVPPPGWVAFTPVNLKGHNCEAIVIKATE